MICLNRRQNTKQSKRIPTIRSQTKRTGKKRLCKFLLRRSNEEDYIYSDNEMQTQKSKQSNYKRNEGKDFIEHTKRMIAAKCSVKLLNPVPADTNSLSVEH